MQQEPAPVRALTAPSATSYAIRAALVFVAYYGSARLGVLLAFPHTNITPFWPPSGIAVAALVLLGRRYWPALLLSEFVLNLTTGLPAAVSGGLAVGNTLEYLLAASLLSRTGFEPSMQRVRDVVLLALLAAAVSPIVAATIGTASLWAGGVIARADLQAVWSVYLVGDGVGILVFTPFILAWSSLPRHVPSRRMFVEAALVATIVPVFAGFVFLGGLRHPYLIFPLVIAVANRYGQRGATATTVVVSLLAVVATTHGLGPFVGSTIERLTNLQLYLAAFGSTALALAATAAAQRGAESAVLKHAARVEESNRELEAFAYTIAHDLRAPLRAINGYSATVMEDYSSQLPADAARGLERIASNAIAMGRLIDALLDFARLGSKHIEWTSLRPSVVAQQAFERLRAGSPKRPVEITIAETPPCLADATLLGLVYQNLIDNSLKFTRDDETVTIDVGWVPASGDSAAPVYYVRDNGIGFDMCYIDKIFGVFQRLHRETDYPGTGAGLAIAKRIVTRHGGAIWAHAESGRGATFFFTLCPSAPARN
jgi:signal transduction histidine kinase